MNITEALFRPLEMSPTVEPADVPTQNYCLSDGGKFLSGNPRSTTPQQMDDAFANWGKDPSRPIVAFFHGGLVSEETGYSNAQNLIKPYSDAGGYPYFFVWRSGLLETIGDALHGIFTNSIVAHILDTVQGHADSASPQVRSLLAQPQFAELPKTDAEWVQPALAEAIHHDVESDLVFQSMLARAGASHAMTLQFAPERTPLRTYTDEAVIARIQRSLPASVPVGGVQPLSLGMPSIWQIAQKFVEIVGAVIRRRSTGRAHPGICTITEEILRAFFIGDIGKDLWQQMKMDCTDSFGADGNACVGTRFLQNLKQRCSPGKNPRVLLLGHSAGAVYICEFLKAADALPPDVQFDVVMMASACRFDLFDEVRQIRNGARIRSFRNFAMKDANEQQNALIQWPNVPDDAPLNKFLAAVYPASLLYFISGLLEPEQDGDDPLVGMQRFLNHDTVLDALPSVRAVEDYLERDTSPNAEVFSPTGPAAPGLGCDATTHGGFPQEALMLETTQVLIRKWTP